MTKLSVTMRNPSRDVLGLILLRYDVILAANGHRSIFDYMRALSRNTSYVMA